ncbi:MAG: M13 family metallopeptidase [Dokdonella sp.]
MNDRSIQSLISTKPLAAALAIALGLSLAACGSDKAPAPVAETAPPATVAAPEPPYVAFNVSELDSNGNACADFNGYVNSKWITANPIPADKTRWSTFDVLRDDSLKTQHEIVESAAADAGASGNTQKIGAFWKSGMDEAAVDAAGATPLQPELDKIAAITDSKTLVAYLQDSFARGVGTPFSFGAGADFNHAETQIAYAFQGGTGLPTRDYYLDDQYKDIRDAYVAHVAKTLELTGVATDAAAKQAQAVMKFETMLAKASFAPVELRNPDNQYNFVTIKQANKITPHFDWDAFFKAQDANVADGFSLSQPKFFTALDNAIAKTPVADWQAYLRYQIADGASPYLSQPFQQEYFAFHGQKLGGQKEMEPRWKRVLGEINENMGMAMGELYVAKAFPPEAKARAEELINNLQAALRNRIENLDWMSAETKTRAIEKWQSFLPKIGYPDQWRDWAGLAIAPDSYYGNAQAAAKFNHAWDVARIGKPTDRKEWGMTPQTVNAYYNPTDNTINFPAAILQPPFFDAKADDALNYGGIGAVIGHEASHGFDDQGSQFDAKGNRANWWSDADKAAFKSRTAKLVDQFAGYEALPGKYVNGELTLGENIADLGGLSIAWDALQTALAKNPAMANEKIDGYTPAQRFFLNWARVWRGSTREERAAVLLNADPHSPTAFRAIGAPSNLPEFAAAFECKTGDKMVRDGDSQVKIW